MKKNFSRMHRIEQMIAFGRLNFNTGDDAGGSGSGDKTTFTREEVSAEAARLAQEIVDRETAGLRTKNQELLGQIQKIAPLAKKVEGMDIDGLLAFKTKIENDEILKLASEGKHTEAIDKATEKLRVTHSAELQSVNEQFQSTQTENQSLKQALSTLIIDGTVKTAFIREKGVETGVEDVVLRAQTIFKVENGEATARDKDGKIIQGEKGPLTVEEWVRNLKKTAPHLFPSSSGGNASGGNSGSSSSSEESRIAAAKLGPQALREWKAEQRKKTAR